MNNLNSVILEGTGYNEKRGESITIRSKRYKAGPDGVETGDITVPVVALCESVAESMLQLIDGQGVRVTGRLVEHNGTIAVGASYMELRRMRKPEQVDLAEVTE